MAQMGTRIRQEQSDRGPRMSRILQGDEGATLK
jgi:hypothetical protein